MNQVELWFAKIQRDVITRGVFTSVADLARKLQKYIRAYAESAKPFRWTYTEPSATQFVLTKSLGQVTRAYWRTLNRFPLDFMFQLSEEEAAALRSHSATSKTGRGGRRYLPYAFTEHGALMLASVLTSTIAVDVRIVAFWPYPIPLICAQGPYVNQMRQSRFFSDFPYSSLERVFMGMDMTFR